MKILFITRKSGDYSAGGMEKLSDNLIRSVGDLEETRVDVIVWKHSQKLLPLFFVIAFLRSCLLCLRGIDIIHIGDAVLTPLGVLLRALFPIPIVVTVHGLDLVFHGSWYQDITSYFLRKYDTVVCISYATQQICLTRGIQPERCRVIHPGVSVPLTSHGKPIARQLLKDYTGVDLTDAKVLATIGRLVPRKGVSFFVQQVLPVLVRHDPAFIYVIVGEGPHRQAIEDSITEQHLDEHVLLTGFRDEQFVSVVYGACDLVVIPNIPQPNDIEGFGLVSLEAQAAGCPVLVSDLEGLKDTVPENHSNWLVPAGDASAWVTRVERSFEEWEQLSQLGAQARDYMERKFCWSKTCLQYMEVFTDCVGKKHAG